MTRVSRIAITVVLATVVAVPGAQAWGPRASLAIVTAASNLISRESRVPLPKLEKDIQAGAGASSREMSAMYPGYETKPIETIEMEMYLLQAVRSDRLDPYFAYRLGVLGKLVAQVTAPMAQKTPAYRNLYYADVDENIDNVRLKPSRLTTVDPKGYFSRVLQEAALRDDVYEQNYRDGIGFSETAKGSLSEDASRSITAVVDVWYTILTGNAVHANRSEAGIRDYVVSTLEYYVQHDKEGYIDNSYDRLLALTRNTPELRQRIGDMFFGAQYYDRAMAEYQAALSLAPGNKDIARKISEYYVQQGDSAMDQGNFEAAQGAFAKALEADPLHPTAESKRLLADKLIAEREARFKEAQDAILAAQDSWRRADEAALDNRIAEAIGLLNESEKSYQLVTDEFTPLFKESDNALKKLMYRMRELKERLVADAQNLSGSGFMQDVPKWAQGAEPGLEQDALRALVRQRLKAQTDALRQEMQGDFQIQ